MGPSLGYVLVGLLGRALVDKLLAIHGGAVAVADWAQVCSVAEVVANVSLTGIGTALTVLSAGGEEKDRLSWLKPALLTAMALSLAVAVAGLPLVLAMDGMLAHVERPLMLMALAAGWLNVSPGLLIAHFLGTRQIGRAAAMVVAGFLLPVALLLASPQDGALHSLLVGQMLWGALVAGALAFTLRGRPPLSRRSFTTLLRFMPAGLAIGILSPAATAWGRVEIASCLSWQGAGQVQAIWRTTDWVTAIIGGVLNAHVLPRLGAAADRRAFVAEIRRAAAWSVLPAAAALGLLWLLLPWVLPLLYQADMGVGRPDVLFFLVGDWFRILSWLALFGLFARRSAWAITLGEFLSLPLFVALVAVVGPQDLAHVGLLWLLTYLTYALFNAALLHWSLAPGQAKMRP
jgi:polysaccharide transporter, PST family